MRKILNKPLEFDTQGYVAFRFDLDAIKMKKVYERLRNKISLKKNRANSEMVLALLDSSADDFLDAADLFLMAKDENEKFSLYYDEEMSKLMGEAQEALEKKKQKKEITSQITKELKMAWIYKNHKQKIGFLENKKRELKIILRRMENLKEAWRARLSSIQSQSRAVDTQRNIRLGGKDG